MCGRVALVATRFDTGRGWPGSPLRGQERDLLAAHRIGVALLRD